MTKILTGHHFLDLPSEGYLFVITYGRSGSTLTQNLLNAIPGYCIRGENNNVTAPLCRAIQALEGDTNIRQRQARARNPAAKVAPDIVEIMGKPIDPWYGAETINTTMFGRGLFNSFVRACLNLPEGTRVGGFKEIRLPHWPEFFKPHVDTLRKFFPSPRFIFQTRDHATLSKSAWWASRDPQEVKGFLNTADRLFLDYVNEFPDSCFHLPYEAYSSGPWGLQPLFNFLGEPFDPDMVEAVMSQKLNHAKSEPAEARPANTASSEQSGD